MTPCCCSHGAMQSLWNTCRQGSRMICKPSSKGSKQMLQLLSTSSALSSASLACNPVSMLRPGMGRCGRNCTRDWPHSAEGKQGEAQHPGEERHALTLAALWGKHGSSASRSSGTGSTGGRPWKSVVKEKGGGLGTCGQSSCGRAQRTGMQLSARGSMCSSVQTPEVVCLCRPAPCNSCSLCSAAVRRAPESDFHLHLQGAQPTPLPGGARQRDGGHAIAARSAKRRAAAGTPCSAASAQGAA